MNKENFVSIKITLTGDANVGKSSLIDRQIQNCFKEIRTTVGMDFKIKFYSIKNTKIKAQLWDGLGHTYEKLQSMNRLYYKDANAIGACFSLNERQTFDNLEKRIKVIKNINKTAKIFLIGCKSDLCSIIPQDLIEQFAKKYEITYLKTSAKQNVGVIQAFQQMIQKGSNVKQIQLPKLSETSNAIEQNQKRQCQIM